MERMAVWEENYVGSVPERMRDIGGRTNPLRESLKSHLEDGCGATVPSETELRELPTKKKKESCHFSDFTFMLFVCTVVITLLSPSTATSQRHRMRD